MVMMIDRSFIYIQIFALVLASVYSLSCKSGGYCEQPLSNLVDGLNFEVSSLCGIDKREEICFNEEGNRKKCEICDNTKEKEKHQQMQRLYQIDFGKNTDKCWYSKQVSLQENTPTNANLTVKFNKRSLIAFLTMELCGHIPDAIVIYKSEDLSKNHWIPWQYFAKDCRRAFQMEHLEPYISSDDKNSMTINTKCFDLMKSIDQNSEISKNKLIPFNPKQGRGFGNNLSKKEQDFLSASALKISFIKLPDRRRVAKSIDRFSRKSQSKATKLYFGASNINVGGQAQCNGHAQQLIKDHKTGESICRCLHYTAGKDCEKCHEHFNDLPWKPSTESKPSTCQKCHCNYYSKFCDFDESVFKISGMKHGSKCKDCQDNTTGDFCEKCKPGFFRDLSLPIYHKSACKPCNCHSIGAVSNLCNSETGKCECKQGVIGSKCTKCASGYKHSNNQKRPCQPIKKHNLRSADMTNACSGCNSLTKKFNLNRFCRKDLNVKVSLKSTEIRDKIQKFTLWVEEEFENGKDKNNQVAINANTKELNIWVDKALVDCGCIHFGFDKSYLLNANIRLHDFFGKQEMILTKRSMVLPWSSSLINEFKDDFVPKMQKGECQVIRSRRANRITRRNSYRRNLTYRAIRFV